MLSHSLQTFARCPQNEVNIHYFVDEMHGNDTRVLSSRARLCVSGKVGTKSCWLKSDAIKGKMTVPLVRVKDMVVPTVTGGAEYARLSPAERAQQRGASAASSMITALCEGTGAKKLLVVDVSVGSVAADWARGAWQLIQARQSRVRA